MSAVNSQPVSRHELHYLEQLRRRIGGNLYRLENMSIFANATQIEEMFVHGSPRTPHRRGGILDISANDFQFLISAGVISPAVRVEHSRGSYYLDMLVEELEHFTGYDAGTN